MAKYTAQKYCENCKQKCEHLYTEDGSYNETKCMKCGHVHTWKGGFLKS